MIDVMLLGILRMPPSLWQDNEINNQARFERYKEAADRIEQLERDLSAAREWIAKQPCKHKLASWNPDKILEGGGKGGIEKFDCGKCQPCRARIAKANDGN